VALRFAGLTYGLALESVRLLCRRLKLSAAMGSLLSAIARISGAREAARAGGAERTRALRELLTTDVAVGRPAVLFLWDSAPWEPEAIMLTAAAEGSQGGAPAAARRLMSLYARRAGGEMPSLPVDGDALMRELGLEPGPMLGTALREARLAWEAGEARSKAEALAAARGAVTLP
jgi:hypothetical protein